MNKLFSSAANASRQMSIRIGPQLRTGNLVITRRPQSTTSHHQSSIQASTATKSSEIKKSNFVFVNSKSPSYTRHVQAWILDFRTNKRKGLCQIDASIFACPIRTDILHRVVVYTLAKRRGFVYRHQKTRAEVRGSHRKVRPQKGAGRARIGDRRSPVCKGGGRAFPAKPRDFSIKLNRKIRDFGMRAALSSKYAQGQLVIVSGFKERLSELLSPSSTSGSASGSGSKLQEEKIHRQLLSHVGMEKSGAKVLLAHGKDEGHDVLTKFDAKSGASFVPVDELQVYDILRNDYLVLTKEALGRIEERYHWY